MIPYKKHKLAIGLITFLILIFIGSITLDIIKNERERKTYTEITKARALSGIVFKKEIKRTASIVTMDNDRKFMLYWADNYDYNPYKLSEFLQVGDSVFKNEDSDTIFILRNHKQYFFRMSIRIGKDNLSF